MGRQMPTYDELTKPKRPMRGDAPDETCFPAVFDRNVVMTPLGPKPKVGNQGMKRDSTPVLVKRERLRDQLQKAYNGSGDHERALQLAAFAVGGDVTDIPEEAKESLATLTAWVFAMRAVGGSVEHFREIGDRVDPKPKRIEIEGVVGARTRGGSGSNPDEVAEANAYYATLGGAVIDASYTKEDDDLSFLD